MKKILFTVILVALLCCGCSKALIDKAEIESRDNRILELENEVSSAKSKEAELKQELGTKELEISRLEEIINNSVLYENYIVDTDLLNVRREPSSDAEVIGMLEGKELIRVIEEIDDDWVKIIYNGREAYVMKVFISPLSKKNDVS